MKYEFYFIDDLVDIEDNIEDYKININKNYSCYLKKMKLKKLIKVLMMKSKILLKIKIKIIMSSSTDIQKK